MIIVIIVTLEKVMMMISRTNNNDENKNRILVVFYNYYITVVIIMWAFATSCKLFDKSMSPVTSNTLKEDYKMREQINLRDQNKFYIIFLQIDIQKYRKLVFSVVKWGKKQLT